ncbi:MAG: hypothetical protein V1862_09750 [Methanobacteriota archaeon]
MTQQRGYLTGCITILLAILILFIIEPVGSADDDYLDGGFLSMPAWLYARLDPTAMSNIIGVVHGHTFFSPSEDPPSDTGHSFIRDIDYSPRMKHWVFW